MDGVHTANWTARVDERIDRIEIDAAESGWISIYVSLTAIRVRPATSTPRFPRLFIRGGRADTRGTPHEAHTRGPQPHRQGFQPPTIARGRQFMRRIPSVHSCTTLSYVGRRVSGFQPAEIRTLPRHGFFRFDACRPRAEPADSNNCLRHLSFDNERKKNSKRKYFHFIRLKIFQLVSVLM